MSRTIENQIHRYDEEHEIILTPNDTYIFHKHAEDAPCSCRLERKEGLLLTDQDKRILSDLCEKELEFVDMGIFRKDDFKDAIKSILKKLSEKG